MSTINTKEEVTIKNGQYNKYNTVDLVIPSNIRIIEKGAFSGFPNLRSVKCESGSELEIIEEEAFFNCQRLNTVILPNTIKEIGVKAFSQCKEITSFTIPSDNQIESIGDNAFYQLNAFANSKPSKLVFSSALKYLGESAFNGCKLFNEVDFSKVISLTEIPTSAFAGSSVIKVTMPTSGCIKKIGMLAFSHCKLLKFIIPASGIEKIFNKAFECCDITSFDFSGVKYIDYFAFSLTKLEKATVPTDCEVKEQAFDNRCQLFKKDLPLLEPYDSSSSSAENGDSVINKIKGFFGRFKK